MRIIAVILLLASSAALAASPGDWQSFWGSPGQATDMTVLETDAEHVVVQVSLPGFWLYDYPAGGQTWQRLEVPGCAAHDQVGMPEMPSFRKLIAMPFGTSPVITVESVEYVPYEGVALMPRQIPEVDMEHAPYDFVINGQFYESGGLFPQDWASIDNDGVWSGLHVARLTINPFKYDPTTEQLLVASSVVVEVEFDGSPEALAYPSNPGIYPAFKDRIVNFETFAQAATQDGPDDTPEYLFLVNSGNIDAVAPLAEEHNLLGLKAKVITLSDPASVDDIKTAITDNYETGVTRFALIAGDHDEMPSYSYSGFVGDLYYSCISGGDHYPEIFTGRLTGSSSQITTQVNKIIDGYIEYSFSDENTTGVTPSETVLAAHEEQYPGKYTECCDSIAAYPYSLCDITFTKVYPPEGGTANDVENAINNEIGTVGYRGHGNVQEWSWSPGWTASNINSLTNSYMPPVYNIACYCGQYQTSTECLAESWAWHDHGASGNLSANDPSYTTANHDYMKRIYRGTYDEGIYRVGEAIAYATEYILDNHGSYGQTNAQMYIWFGDPGMDIWTFDTGSEPVVLAVDAPTWVSSGTQTINIHVDGDGSDEGDVTVTLTDGVEGLSKTCTVYEEGLTNSSGDVSFTVDIPSSCDSLYVGAFKHDCTVDFAGIDVQVGVSDFAEVVPNFGLYAPSPNPVTVSAAVRFSLTTSGHVDLAVYDVAGRRVQSLVNNDLESGQHTVTWQPTDLASGVYFLRLSTSEGVLTHQAMVLR